MSTTNFGDHFGADPGITAPVTEQATYHNITDSDVNFKGIDKENRAESCSHE